MTASGSSAPADSPPAPDRKHARVLVTSLACFWGAFAVLAAPFDARVALGVTASLGFVGVVAGFAFYATLFDVWRPVSGRPGWQLALGSNGRTKVQAMLCLFRPRWDAGAFAPRVGPMSLLVTVLPALLTLDLALYVVLVSRLFS